MFKFLTREERNMLERVRTREDFAAFCLFFLKKENKLHIKTIERKRRKWRWQINKTLTALEVKKCLKKHRFFY